MISPVRAVAVVATGTVGTLIISVVVAKTAALVLGPAGVGLLGLLQSVLGLTVMITGFGVAVGIVRFSRIGVGPSEFAATRRAAWLLSLATGTAGALILWLGREWLSTVLLAGVVPADDLIWLAPAVLFTLAYQIEFASINAHHRVRLLTVATVSVSAASAACLIAAVLIGGAAPAGTDFLAVALAAGSFLGYLIARFYRKRGIGTVSAAPTAKALTRRIADLATFGLPYAASQVATSAALLILPLMVVGTLGDEATGHYRAASTIALGYGALALRGLAADYVPRVVASSRERLARTVDDQATLVAAMAIPATIIGIAVAPIIMGTLYSEDFIAATDLLAWLLAGNLLKVAGSVLVLVVAARASSTRFLAFEGAVAVMLILATAVLAPLLGLMGVGVAVFLASAVYFVASWQFVAPDFALRPGRRELVTIAAPFIALTPVVLFPDPLALPRIVSLVALAAVASAVSWPHLRSAPDGRG